MLIFGSWHMTQLLLCWFDCLTSSYSTRSAIYLYFMALLKMKIELCKLSLSSWLFAVLFAWLIFKPYDFVNVSICLIMENKQITIIHHQCAKTDPIDWKLLWKSPFLLIIYHFYKFMTLWFGCLQWRFASNTCEPFY